MDEHPIIDGEDHNPPVFSVSALAQAIRNNLEQGFGNVRVRGEISGLRRASSGHCYFALKDTDAVIDSVCWRTVADTLAIKPEDGLEVVVTGRLTTYPARSRYQVIVSRIEVAGEGALLKILDERRRRLAEEGLFDTARKRPIPFLPRTVGVVTSPTGSVFQDILHRIAERCPRRIILWPVLVQGPSASEQISSAITGFNALAPGGAIPQPDVIIVARGGGSLEDLMAFNEENVVRAVAASTIAVISAVGHETDTTLIDFAADIRAPTPTAAAEKAVPVRADLMAELSDKNVRLTRAMCRLVENRRESVDARYRAIPSPMRVMTDARQRIDDLGDRLRSATKVTIERHDRLRVQFAARLIRPGELLTQLHQKLRVEKRALDLAFTNLLRAKRERLSALASVLESLSYHDVLRRGFALVRDPTGQTVTSVRRLKTGETVEIRLHDGSRAAVVHGRAPGAARPAVSGAKQPPAQRRLL
jgi:exodeoxyribonuclease VII large subunit